MNGMRWFHHTRFLNIRQHMMCGWTMVHEISSRRVVIAMTTLVMMVMMASLSRQLFFNLLQSMSRMPWGVRLKLFNMKEMCIWMTRTSWTRLIRVMYGLSSMRMMREMRVMWMLGMMRIMDTAFRWSMMMMVMMTMSMMVVMIVMFFLCSEDDQLIFPDSIDQEVVVIVWIMNRNRGNMIRK